MMAACGTGCTNPEQLSFLQWHLILVGSLHAAILALEVPARYLGSSSITDYWCVPMVVQPFALGCF